MLLIMKCRICSSKNLEKFLSLGESPLANNFLKKEDLEKEELKFPLELVFCNICQLVQLSYVVDPKLMFKNYVYVSSTSNTFRQHFTKMAEDLKKDFNLDENSLAIDIGSNDGVLLNGLQKFNIKVTGVEPATNVAKIAEENGVETINDFFNKEVVNKIIDKKGKADVVTACNVFAHIDNINSVIENVKLLLKDSGIFVIEVQYLVNTIEDMTFDNIYHEHLSYYSLTALKYFFEKRNMEIFNAIKILTHGGSLRVFTQQKNNKRKINENVNKILDHEKKIGINNIEVYKEFADKVYSVKEKLNSYIQNIKKGNRIIVGYGAPAKSTTLLNFCSIRKKEIDYIIDDNPLKIELYTPGTHIPILSSGELEKNTPDYIIILAWNFAPEILKKTKKYTDKGVKFIIPLPEPRIV